MPSPSKANRAPSGHLIRNNLITAPIWDRGNASFTTEGNITDARNADLVAQGDPHLPAGSRAIGASVPSDVKGTSFAVKARGSASSPLDGSY
ncbi:MAG: hypothetical protein ACE5HA_11420 [Anaerolineae bacterium]